MTEPTTDEMLKAASQLHSKPKASEPYLSESIENAIGAIVSMTVHGDSYREQQALEKALRDFARAIIASKHNG